MWSLQPWSPPSEPANQNSTFPMTQMQMNKPPISGGTPMQPDVEMSSLPMINSGPNTQHSGPVTTLSPWTQITPSIMPWAMQNRPNIVRFGDASGNYWSPKENYFKRKSDVVDLELAPSKVLITEEKMTAQLKNMHISNNYVGQRYEVMNRGNAQNRALPTLVLSKEVKDLPNFQKPILPKAMFELLEKSTRALVLWKPPGSLSSQFVPKPPENSSSEVPKPPGRLPLQFIPKRHASEGNDNDNNNTSTSDLNMIKPTGFGMSSMDMEM